MTAWVERISIERMLGLVQAADREEIDIMIDAARYADPLLAGFWEGELLCIVGFVSKTLLSDEAYLWMCSTPLVDRHKLVFGRWCKRVIQAALDRYPTIIGHCGKGSVGWLMGLGAKFSSVDGALEFRIER